MSLSAVIGGNGIFEAVQRGAIEQVAQLIQQDQTVLQQKGWGGFTALHFAALHGNRPIAELLLSSGADPNIPCDAGQTPFHFACRHGNISIMHKMMQHGADLRIVDQQRKTSLHHAVSGGSIVAMQYLWETTMFQFSDGDNSLITPLHMAASTGNTDVVRYLLRNNRCAADAVDQQGATALHVAAEKGIIEVCWLLLQSAGFHILHMKNHTGLTPLDLCNSGTTFRHQQLTKILTQFINKPKDQKPRESYVVYYWTLLLPSLSGAAVLLIAAALGEYGGVFCGLLFPWVAKITLSQYHRMSSYQRLPNPIYLGTLTAGIIHSLVCYYYKILPSLWPAHTLLHISLLHFGVVLGLFWKVLRQDPGRLHSADADPRFTSIADLVEANQNPNRFCIYCELFQVDNCKHCRLCDICVMDYDHHCLFLNHCVGRNNHQVFVLFILAMIVAHLLFISTASYYLYWKMTTEEHWSWSSVTGRESWVLLLLLLNLLTLLWQAWLLSEQFDAISTGTTTYFRRSNSKKPAWGKCLATVLSFLIEGKSFRSQQCISVDI
ncbi:probable protein S-acyltransferase 23 isoform X1 [Pygocentrus nattereri]|uniref:probable protein S-acyltransferase 23 isoform X1 n=1 Tax=Pygocentrus nattereri TaxID=42514 RepID=UPI0008146598|nr:probable protein S-acyltransferase 23 isoform X1 [Pygocentrus nattereri]